MKNSAIAALVLLVSLGIFFRQRAGQVFDGFIDTLELVFRSL